MAYLAIKEYGKRINEMAIRFSKYDNIFDGASSLMEYNEIHYIFSRLACRELYANDIYPGNQRVVTTLYNKFVFSELLKKAFLSKPFKNQDTEIEFIEKGIEDGYYLLCHAQELLMAITVTAYPDRFKESRVKEAIATLKEVTALTEANVSRFNLAYAKLAAKDAQRIEMMQAEAVEQEKNQDNSPGNQKKDTVAECPEMTQNQDGKQVQPAYQVARKYIIENNDLLLQIHKFLVETKVLLSDVLFPVFLEMAINADASNITPQKKWKFITSLWYVATCVKGDQKVWARDICKSIGKKPSDLTKCAEKDPGWLDDLKKLVENNQKNQF